MPEVTEQHFQKSETAISILDSVTKVRDILATIREVGTHLSFAVPTDEKILEIDTIELCKEGGVLVRYKDCMYPRKGFAHNTSVTAVDNVKKVIMGLLKGFAGFRGKLILLFGFVLFRKRVLESFRALLAELHFMLSFHRLKKEWYCTSVREVYQAIPDVAIRDIVSLILEFDDAYRYRFQDAVGELDKTAFAHNPVVEIDRILSLLQAREKDERLKHTWKLMRRLLFISFFFKSVREPIIGAFSRLNPANIKMDDSDRYFASLKQDGYAWGGQLTIKK